MKSTNIIEILKKHKIHHFTHLSTIQYIADSELRVIFFRLLLKSEKQATLKVCF